MHTCSPGFQLRSCLRFVFLVAAALALASCVPLPAATVAPSAPPAIELSPTPPLAATVTALSAAEVRQSLNSPDGKWLVQLSIHPCVETAEGKVAFEQLLLTEVASGQPTVIANQLRYCEGLGAFGLEPVTWSANSRYLYYTDAREGGPDGGCRPWLRPLFRLDLATGAVDSIEGALPSAGRSRIAGTQGKNVVVWDVEKGELGRVVKQRPDVGITSLAWAPDASRLAYLQSEQPCPPYGASVVMVVDPAASKQRVLLDSPQRGYGQLAWSTERGLALQDAEGKWWSIDTATGELRPGAAGG